MPRYSLASLFLVLVYVSIGSAALVSASGLWPRVMVTVTVAVLLYATLAATCRKNRFAIGFSLTGWVYFLLVFASFLDIRGYLLTDTAVNLLFETIHEDQPALANSTQYALLQISPDGTRQIIATPRSNAGSQNVTSSAFALVDARSFGDIGHSIWTCSLAVIGGVIAQWLTPDGRRKRDKTVTREC